MQKYVSVIIPCYNQARYLAEAIGSALAQDYPYKEIIVINDGSTDVTRAVAADFGNSIVYIEQENRRVSAARNAGIKAARGDYIALLDSDDVCLPGRLSTQMAYLERHPATGLVASDALLYDGKRILGLKSKRSGKPRHPRNFRYDTVEYYFTTSTALIRKELFEQIAYFDECCNYAEEWLLAVQFSLRFNMAYLDFPTILYRLHPESASRKRDLLNAENRRTSDRAISWVNFPAYPPHFRAKLLFYRFATAWRVEPKAEALKYFWRAVATDPRQLPYGFKVIGRGLRNRLAAEKRF